MSKKDELATVGMSAADLGKALIEKAQQDEKKRLVNAASGEVQQILGTIEAYKKKVAEYQNHIAINQRRLEALEQGKFKLDSNGRIVYRDSELDKHLRGFLL